MKSWLKNPKIISAIGFVILILLIWYVGPSWGLEGFDARMMWIFVVIAVWMFTLLVAQLLSIRSGHLGRLIEGMLRREADGDVVGAAAERRAEVKLLRERLLEAIQTLKTSKLGKARGHAALYELPWYMIIGHPSAGKSTALLQSGLTFPFSDQYGAGVQGVGGTRNCDWFFSSEGVLLDTAGRYATETDGRDAWMGFLRLLKRYRSRAPVNGILVAMSLPELVQYRSESFTVYARKIRERIHEVESVFGMRPPVYLIFTKLDLLGGFTQFFADAGEEERARVWGATFSHEQEGEFDVRRAVDEQCELLYRGLRQIGEEKLGLARGAAAKPAFFAFPLEFHALKDGICRFVELLHEDDPYHARPLLRGIYFTSAVQKGEPRIAAASRVSSQFELSRNGFDIQQPVAANAYFLRDLFRDVLFADQNLILRQTRPRVNRIRLASMASGLAALTGAAGLLSLSYADNREMVAAVEAERGAVVDTVAAGSPADRLAALARLQSRLEQLQQYRVDGVPWQIGMGLYQGRKLESALRKQYFDGLRAVMLEPVRGNLEAVLERWAQAPQHRTPLDSAEGYNVLKTYLILGTRKRLDAAWLAEQLPRAWRPWLEAQHISPEALETGDAGRALRFYLSQIHAPDLPLIENNESLIDPSRKSLRHALVQQLPAGERVYAELRHRANAKFPSLTVDFILAGKNTDILTGAAEVPGAFTREAWDKYMKNAIVEASRNGIESEDWVLSLVTPDSPVQEGDAAGKQAELEALYRADYAKAWMSFLRGLAVAGLDDLTRAERGLARLSDTQNSPIKIVLQRAAFETAWDNPSRLSNTVQTARQSVLDRTAGLLHGNTRAPDAGQGTAQNVHYGELGRQFAFLANLAGDNKQLSPMMAGYLERIGRLKARFGKIVAAEEQGLEARELVEATLNGKDSELVDTLRYIDDVMFSPGDAAFREALRPFLAKPLFASYAVLLPPVVEDLNLLWESDVYDEWKTLAAKYPFSNSRDEAELSEIGSFIKSDGVLDAFVDNILGDLVIRRGNQISARHWNGQGVRLESSFVTNVERLLSFSGVLKRGETARFELQPVPTPGLSEIKVEIDGQTLRYRNGPQPWQVFRWPAGEEQGARIQAVAFNGATATVSDQHGRMGLIRMISESKRSYDPKTTRGQLAWRVEGLGEAGEIKLNFNMVSGLNPMQLSALRSVSLPRRIAQ
ncbi:MAG: type VI secretion system membrane subunit TssM [Azoarcus sp.]|jgi:type VI secretion system protein ImpL|nr:type VI secretion system membrane subunit TssM [Azoarcus sp.]